MSAAVRPVTVRERFLPGEAPSLQRILLLTLNSVWWAPLMGGQLLFTLDACREGTAPVRRLRDGLAFTGPMAGLMLLLSLVNLPLELLSPAAAETEPGVGDLVALAWVVVLIVAYVRFGYALVFVVDARLSIAGALRASWRLSRGRAWLLVRLILTFALACVLMVFGTGMRVVPAIALMLLLLYPPMAFAWGHLYLALRNEHDGGR